MMIHQNFIVLLVLTLICSCYCLDETISWPKTDKSFISGECSKLIATFSAAAANFTDCATSHSVPPQLCTTCSWAYLSLQIAFDEIHNTTFRDFDHNISCSEMIFSGYAESFVSEIFVSLRERVWIRALCQECLNYKTVEGEGMFVWTPHTKTYYKKLEAVKNCSEHLKETKEICEQCATPYSDMYQYYWNVFIRPDLKFCLDVEATMNDTIYWWRNQLKCELPKRETRQSQTFVVTFLGVVVLLITVIFYLGSFIQGERKQRKLLKYSRLHSQSAATSPNTPDEGASPEPGRRSRDDTYGSFIN